MHERRFHREIERLRQADRVERMEVARVVDLALAGLDQVVSMLDIGTGSALFAEAFAAKGLRVAGVDANPEMIPVAQGFVPGGTFKVGIAEELPFTDREFDLEFMGLVLHETDDMRKALQEAFRVCKQRLVVLEWPYEVQEIGPGMEERIPTDKLEKLGKEAGFSACTHQRLKQMMYYQLEK